MRHTQFFLFLQLNSCNPPPQRNKIKLPNKTSRDELCLSLWCGKKTSVNFFKSTSPIISNIIILKNTTYLNCTCAFCSLFYYNLMLKISTNLCSEFICHLHKQVKTVSFPHVTDIKRCGVSANETTDNPCQNL